MKHFLILLSLLLLLATPVQAAILWDSYSDPARTVQSDNFSVYNSWVFLKAMGLQKNKTYQAKYYDADPNNYPLSPVNISDSQSDNNGVVLSQVKPSAYSTSSPGTWKAELWKMQPLTLEATDTFTVQGSAIPEFPTKAASVGVVFICLLIFWLMKRRSKL